MRILPRVWKIPMTFKKKTLVYKRYVEVPEYYMKVEFVAVIKRKYFSSQRNYDKIIRKVLDKAIVLSEFSDSFQAGSVKEGWEFRKKAIKGNIFYFSSLKRRKRKDRKNVVELKFEPIKIIPEANKQLFAVSTEYIGLDWDNLTEEQVKFRKKSLRAFKWKYSVNRSSFKDDSYHVKITPKNKYPNASAEEVRKEHFELRKLLLDDLMRLDLDVERDKQGLLFNVLFDKKREVFDK